jgi:DNA-binding CsgD family transcriptional regulator
MAQSDPGLLTLIGEIYDAALKPALWPEAIGKAVCFLPGSAGALFVKDTVNKTGNVYFDDGNIDAHYKQIYFEKYIKFDPSNTIHFFSDIEAPVSTTDILPYDEFVETRFFQEWARPQGYVDFISAALDRTATSAAMFGIFRQEQHGVVDDEARRRMRLIVPHFRRAVLIGKAVELKTAEAAALADTLDHIAAGMILIDSQGRVMQTNGVGQAMLVEGEPLRVTAGRLGSADEPTDEILKDIFKSTSGGDAAIGTKGISVPLTGRGGGHYLAHILPLTSGARQKAGVGYSATAAVFVRKAQVEPPPMPGVIAKHYGLTPSELRVLLAVVFEGGSVTELAASLGISNATAKTHLKKLFEKTGTKRQADLVRLVAGFT